MTADHLPTSEKSPGRKGRHAVHRVTLVTALVLLAAAGIWAIQPHTPSAQTAVDSLSTPPHPVLDFSAPDPLDASVRVVNPGYVGPETCAECHSDRVAEFIQTSHFQTCRQPDPQRMPDGFADKAGIFQTRVPGLHFEMTRSGNKFFQTAVRDTDEGPQRTTTQIGLVYGAGTADEIYFAWDDDDRMYELPIAWLHNERMWAAEYFNPYGTGDYSRPLTLRCLECHNTWFEYVPGSVNQYRREDFIMGISCERCHGPGQEHTEFHRTHTEATSAHAITNPSSLTRERQIEVCTQCHGNAMKHLGPALSYRPGKVLNDSYKTLISRQPDEDHVANQIQYLRESRCFQLADTMTCSTCHDSHRPTDPASSGVDSCLACHSGNDCAERESLPAAVQDLCVDCHMPARIKINVNFQTEDDMFVAVLRRHEHRIAVDQTARDEVLWEWYRTQSTDADAAEAARLRHSLVTHWLSTATDFEQQNRHFAAIASIREALRIDDTPQVRNRLRELVDIQAGIYADWDLAIHQIEEARYAEAVTTLERLLKAQPQHAPAIGKLGTMLAMTGHPDRAIAQYQKVEDADPNDAYGHTMQGWLDYLAGRFAEAVEHYSRAQQIEPYNAKLSYQTGLALLETGEIASAIEQLRSAFAMDPNNPAVCQSLCVALRKNNQPGEAVLFAQRAVRLTNAEDLSLLMVLGETLAESGQMEAAIAAAEAARAIAKKSAPDLLPRVHQTLSAWKSQLRRASRNTPAPDKSPARLP